MGETPTSKAPSRDDRPEPGHRKAARVGWGVYQQVAAVLAAIGIAALLGHWFDIGWRGALADVVGVWDETVRPAMEWVLHILVSVPLSWVGLEFEVPLWLRDYLSVGLVLALSDLRARRSISTKVNWVGDDGELTSIEVAGVRDASIPWYLHRKFAVQWPVAIAYLILYLAIVITYLPRYQTQGGGGDSELVRQAQAEQSAARRAVAMLLFTLLPMLYLALLLAVNSWLMPHI